MSQSLSRRAVKAWLLDYAWSPDHTAAEREAEIACIMSQDGWKYLDARIERDMGQRSGDNSVAVDLEAAYGFELSALYECHDAPHLATCPNCKP